MKDLAIVCSAIPARFPLLQHSLSTWQQSINASGLDCEICLYIEGASVCDAIQYIPNKVGCKIEGGLHTSGSHIMGYNIWLEHMKAKAYVLTHPEILFPTDTVRVAFEKATLNTFAAFKVFWLPQHMTEHLDDYPWQTPERLEQYDDLYKLDPKEKGEFYWNKDIRGITDWQSTTTYAMDYLTIRKLLPFPEFGTWGPDDPWHVRARRTLGIQDVTLMEPVLFHQWHPSLQDKSIEDIVQQANEVITEQFPE